MSSAIADIQYSETTRTLVVSFVKGGSHTYTGVSPELYQEFMEAPSQGGFFNAIIRPMAPGRSR
jgi:hypothetical protein